MSGDECPQKINFSSSDEDEYRYNSDTGDIEHVNLVKRISKMGKTQAAKSTRKKKSASTKEKERLKEKENTKKNVQSSKSNKKGRSRSDVLSESKKAITNLSSGFITTRRLTTGVTGIFGSSRASNVVKRKGRRMSVDLDNRKTSVAVKEQVNRNLNRIINPSYDQKSNQLHNTSIDELSMDEQLSKPAFGAVSASESRQTKIQSRGRNVRAPSSSSSSGGRSAQFVTPVTRLLSETPLVEISKNLKESLVLSELFPGKRIIEEIRDELRKVYRQDCSLLDETLDQSSPQAQVPKIAPITVSTSRHHRSFDKIMREEAAPAMEIAAPQEERMDIQMVGYQDMMVSSKQSEEGKMLLNHPPQHQNSLPVETFHRKDHAKSSKTNQSVRSPPFQIISRVTEATSYEPKNTDTHTVVISDGMIQPCEYNQPIANVEPNNAEWINCAVAVQRLPYSTSQWQQDSGTYSEESSARDKATTDRVMITDTRIPDDIRASTFQPRRQGNKDNLLRNTLYCHEMKYPEGYDHDYHIGANSYDILHYAEAMEYKEDDCDQDGQTSNSVNTFSYLPVPKKPCVETPTPPMQLFRLKMF